MFARVWWLLFWLAVGVAGAGALVMEWQHPPGLPGPVVVDTPATVAVPPLQPFDPLGLPHYAEIVERPVFIEARRPEEDDSAAAPTPPAEPDQPLDLIGVLLIPGRAAALLRPTEPNAKVLRVAQGEMVEGWQLQSVNADRVVLRKDGEVRELVLIRPPTPTRPVAPGKVPPFQVNPGRAIQPQPPPVTPQSGS